MNTVLVALDLLFLTTEGILVTLIVYIYRRLMGTEEARYFLFLLLSVAVYNLAYLGELNGGSLPGAYLFLKIEYLSILFQTYLADDDDGILRRAGKMRKELGNLFVFYPPFLMLAFFTNPLTHLYYESVRFENAGPFLS